MAYFLFVDESGQDRKSTPYEVLAGVAVQDVALWDLIQDVHTVEEKYFGSYYRDRQRELKAKTLLKTKTFRLAAQLPSIDQGAIQRLAQACLTDGPNARKLHLTALAQAKIRYCEEVFRICTRYDCNVFASVIDYQAIAAQPQLSDFVGLDYLRKDYSFLFERFYYYLEDLPKKEMGAVVFDELERSKSHILHEQMRRYFIDTRKGRERSTLIIPEPLFVHSDLTTGIHLADLVAYCIAWGFRIPSMQIPKREELAGLVDLICSMRYRATRIIPDIQDTPSEIWSIAVINS
ncbi:MAG: DUF3800 domain-containing protein [Anaerolineales bacterium]|nr:DUF3800 domain-containing protein [Chloroflexota bacterium]MBL6982734.1 DUF3800 domain-containing protein [Anaerolineales bacterium]